MANNSASRTVTVKGNKVQNGSFEQSSNGTSPDGWSGSGSTAYGSGGTDGSRAVSAGPGGSWTSAPISVEAGRTYGFSVVLFGAATGSAIVDRVGPTGLLLGSVPIATGDLLTIVAGTTSVQIRLVGGLAGTSTFDDVRLWEE